MKNRIRIARGTSEELRQSTAKAEKGVPFYDITNKRLYIGKGTKDTDPMLKDYIEDDSIVAYKAENAVNAIVNTDNNTYIGWRNSTNLGLHITNGDVVNNHSPIVEVKTLITNSTINKTISSHSEPATDTIDFDFTTDDNTSITILPGSIIEVVSSLGPTPIRIIYNSDGDKGTGTYTNIFKNTLTDKWETSIRCLDVYVYANKISFGMTKNMFLPTSDSSNIAFGSVTVYGVFLITNKIEYNIRNLQNN